MGANLGCSTDRACCGCSSQHDVVSKSGMPVPASATDEGMSMETDTLHDLTEVAAAAGLATPSKDVAFAARDDGARSAKGSHDSGLVMVFSLPDGSDQTVCFGEKQPPLGMDFSTKVPVNVKRVKPGGHADGLGVQEEWIIKAINGESVQGWEPKDIFNKLSKVVMGDHYNSVATSPAIGAFHTPATSPIPPVPGGGMVGVSASGMVLGFRTAEGVALQINFAERRPPLGMDFERAAPVRVKRVIHGGHAEELGVKQGWVVISVNGEDVETMEFNDVFARMRVASSSRPEMPKMANNFR